MRISSPGRGRRMALYPRWLGVLLLIRLAMPVEAQTADAPPAAEKGGGRLHVLDFSGPRELKDFFHYTPDRLPFVSAHRGGPAPGFPENCIATFDHTIRHTWSVMEVDPRYSKDGTIVLMHDATLDRTSSGHGKVSDHTLAELRQLRLKDRKGDATPYRIPTLDEALEWAKGKTVLILDKKDVPTEARARAIRDHHAEAYAMVMCPKFEDAKICYGVDKGIMMEIFIPDRAAVLRFDKTGVPWSNVVAFISHGQPRDPEVFSLVHERGAMCIMGSSRNLDRAFSAGEIGKPERDDGYRQLVQTGADIIEADLGTAAGEALQPMQGVKSSKKQYFQD